MPGKGRDGTGQDRKGRNETGWEGMGQDGTQAKIKQI